MKSRGLVMILMLMLLVACGSKRRVLHEEHDEINRGRMTMQRDSVVHGMDLDEVELLEVEWWGDEVPKDSVAGIAGDVAGDAAGDAASLSARGCVHGIARGRACGVARGGYRIRRSLGRHEANTVLEQRVATSNEVVELRSQEYRKEVVPPKHWRYVTFTTVILVFVMGILAIWRRSGRLRRFFRVR